MKRCALLLWCCFLAWFAGCGGGSVQRASRLSEPVFLYCVYYNLENGRWPGSKEDLVSFNIRGSRHFARLSGSKRKALSGLDWQKYHNMTFGLEGGGFKVRFDYRDARKGICLADQVLYIKDGNGWPVAPQPTRSTDAASRSDEPR